MKCKKEVFAVSPVMNFVFEGQNLKRHIKLTFRSAILFLDQRSVALKKDNKKKNIPVRTKIGFTPLGLCQIEHM